MKIAELKQKSQEELESLLRENKFRVDELRFLIHQKKVKNFKEMGVLKKDIARIQTILRGLML